MALWLTFISVSVHPAIRDGKTAVFDLETSDISQGQGNKDRAEAESFMPYNQTRRLTLKLRKRVVSGQKIVLSQK
jgi:hypothetical protein